MLISFRITSFPDQTSKATNQPTNRTTARTWPTSFSRATLQPSSLRLSLWLGPSRIFTKSSLFIFGAQSWAREKGLRQISPPQTICKEKLYKLWSRPAVFWRIKILVRSQTRQPWSYPGRAPPALSRPCAFAPCVCVCQRFLLCVAVRLIPLSLLL